MFKARFFFCVVWFLAFSFSCVCLPQIVCYFALLAVFISYFVSPVGSSDFVFAFLLLKFFFYSSLLSGILHLGPNTNYQIIAVC